MLRFQRVAFVFGLLFYLFFSVLHPYLHTHKLDTKHHPECPSCKFLLFGTYLTFDVGLGVVFVLALLLVLVYRSVRRHASVFLSLNNTRAPPVEV